MKSRANKILNNDSVVTKSILKKEVDRIEKALMFIIKELSNMRKENRELYQMRE